MRCDARLLYPHLVGRGGDTDPDPDTNTDTDTDTDTHVDIAPQIWSDRNPIKQNSFNSTTQQRASDSTLHWSTGLPYHWYIRVSVT